MAPCLEVTLVALSASYGAAGSIIGPEVARRLGVPFLDRAIPVQVAEQLEVSIDDATAHDEGPSETFLDRLLKGFVGADVGAPTPVPPEAFTSDDFRKATEEVLLRQCATGEGVFLGRASVVVLREHPGVLRVRLDGPAEARIRQAVALGERDADAAGEALRRMDRTHADYAKQFYGVDITAPSLYHLVIDSTSIPVEACVELIVLASRERSKAQ